MIGIPLELSVLIAFTPSYIYTLNLFSLWNLRNTFCSDEKPPAFNFRSIPQIFKTSKFNLEEISKSPLSAKEINPLSNSLSMCGDKRSPLFPSIFSASFESFQGLMWLAIKKSLSFNFVTLHSFSIIFTFVLKIP